MILDYLASKAICSDDLVVVSPDVGGVARARAFAKKLSDAPLAIVDKRRQGHNVAEVRPKEKLFDATPLYYSFVFCNTRLEGICSLFFEIQPFMFLCDSANKFYEYLKLYSYAYIQVYMRRL